MNENELTLNNQKKAFEISSLLASSSKTCLHYQAKANLLKEIRKITKPVHRELNDYFSSVRGSSPMFGFPTINYEDEENPQSSWSLISQNIVMKNKHGKDQYLRRIISVS